jgi:hypothetical protein
MNPILSMRFLELAHGDELSGLTKPKFKGGLLPRLRLQDRLRKLPKRLLAVPKRRRQRRRREPPVLLRRPELLRKLVLLLKKRPLVPMRMSAAMQQGSH